MFCTQPIWAQWNYEITPVSGLNTTENDLACGRYKDGVFFLTNGSARSKSGRSWNEGSAQKLYNAQIKGSFNEFQGLELLLNFKGSKDEGSASYNPIDSTLYFATSNYNADLVREVGWSELVFSRDFTFLSR
jgi:hypothetical protein